MVKWLKWKTCLAVQHEKGPLVNDARRWGPQRMLIKKIKGGLCFIFALNVVFFNPRRNGPALYRNPGGIYLWNTMKCPGNCPSFPLWRCQSPVWNGDGSANIPFLFLRCYSANNVENKWQWGPVGSAFGSVYLPELLHEVMDNQIQQRKIVKTMQFGFSSQLCSHSLNGLGASFGTIHWEFFGSDSLSKNKIKREMLILGSTRSMSVAWSGCSAISRERN